jgi:pimeloyl-ACP methyl ester carboxylesterase
MNRMPHARAALAALGTALSAIATCAAAAETDARHLIYLHGRIVQDQQSARPRHAEWGYYELEQILAAFRERGFVVSGEIRPRDATLDQSAERVAEQVRALRASGVALERITIVGGSMGAAIAFRAAIRLQEPGLRVAVLGACMASTLPHLVAEYGRAPAGNFLTVRETSDKTSEPCPAWQDDVVRYPSLRAREVVISTGQDHGFLYRPLPEWLEPFTQWATLR